MSLDQFLEHDTFKIAAAYKLLDWAKLVAFNNNHHHATVAYNMGPFWTKGQLRNNLPVGQDNHYLDKVLKNYYHITKTLSQTTNVAFIPRI